MSKSIMADKIEIIRTVQNNWNAFEPDGPWACAKTPEKALERLMRVLRVKRKRRR